MLCNMNAVCDMEKISGGSPMITVVDAVPEHVRILGRNQRQRDIDMSNRMGISPHRTLWRLYKRSLVCKTVFVGDEIVAMFGVNGIFMGKVGHPWLIASPFVEEYPLKLAFNYRNGVKNMLKLFPMLEDLVCVDDEKTIKFLGILGFKFGEPQIYSGVECRRATLEV